MKTKNLNILDYSDFKKIFESKLFEEEDLDQLAKEIAKEAEELGSHLSTSVIAAEVKDEVGKDLKDINIVELKENVNEGLLTIAGVALSGGKVAEWLGKGVKYAGKKMSLKGVENVGSWLEKGGHKYTKAIEEKMIMPALKLIPAYKNADKETQEKYAKYVLIGLIGALAVSSGFELVNAVKEGHGLMVSLKTTMIAAKSEELSHLVGQVIGEVVHGAAEVAEI